MKTIAPTRGRRPGGSTSGAVKARSVPLAGSVLLALRAARADHTDWYRLNPTPVELNAVLGPRWAIAPDTETNRDRYGVCIDRKRYDSACREALRRRAIASLVITATATRGLRERLDVYAVDQAAKFLEEEAVAMRFTMEMPSGQKLLGDWLRRNGLNGNEPLRDRVTQLCHIEEMARRLRRMLEPAQKSESKGASRPARKKSGRPVMTRKSKEK